MQVWNMRCAVLRGTQHSEKGYIQREKRLIKSVIRMTPRMPSRDPLAQALAIDGGNHANQGRRPAGIGLAITTCAYIMRGAPHTRHARNAGQAG